MNLFNMSMKGTDIASAGTIALPGDGLLYNVTGTTGINTINTGPHAVNSLLQLQFSGSLTLTYDATKLILPGAADAAISAHDVLQCEIIGTNQIRVLEIARAAGAVSDAAVVHLAGAETLTGPKLHTAQYNASMYALTDGSIIALDWANGNVQSVTLGGSRTFTFANPVAGARYIIELIQDGTGSRTVTWPTIKWAGGTAPTLTAAGGKKDIVTIVYDGTDYLGSAVLNF